MNKVELLLTDEAIGQGALDAGISGAYAYPGTPSTEILEYIQQNPAAADRGVHREWSANEKTAMEEALGMSFAGRRALVAMKHVGLNVAADPFINAAITGVNGGLVVVAADDPAMHSSQNEQDSRFYAAFAMVPLLEPASQQEAYVMTRYAFELSEQVRLPVLLRITTRLAHSRADVTTTPGRGANPLSPIADKRQFVLLPSIARRNYEVLLAKQDRLRQLALEAGYNRLVPGRDRSLGIIACGIAWNYLMESFDGDCPYPVLAIRHYPAPQPLLRELAGQCDALLVLEEGAPLLEERLNGLAAGELRVRGRLDGTLPRAGELTPDSVARAVGRAPAAAPAAASSLVVARPPSLCAGCPHTDTYLFLNEALRAHPDARVFSDIGCYTLGALPPFEAIWSCVDMGASITMAKGAADAGVRPALAVIGDSTFTHSGITGLLDAVSENSPITVLILDNDLTAMTGGQSSLASGRLEGIARGLGVAPEHIRVIVPVKKQHAANVAVLQEEIAHRGVSVVIARRPCIHAVRKG